MSGAAARVKHGGAAWNRARAVEDVELRAGGGGRAGDGRRALKRWLGAAARRGRVAAGAVALAAALCAGGARAEAPSDEALFRSGSAALANGEYGAAIDSLEALADRGFLHPDASYDRGLAYLMRIRAHAERPGDLGRAAAAFEETLRLAPDDHDAEAALDLVRAEVTRRRARKAGSGIDARPTLDRVIAGLVSDRAWSIAAIAASVLLAIGLVLRRFDRPSRPSAPGARAAAGSERAGGAAAEGASGAGSAGGDRAGATGGGRAGSGGDRASSAEPDRAASPVLDLAAAPAHPLHVAGTVLVAVSIVGLLTLVPIAWHARTLHETTRPGVVVATEAHLTDDTGRALGGDAIPEAAAVEVGERRGAVVHVRWGAEEGWLPAASVRVLP